jgi:molybdate transport system substrate-binding protein
LTKVEQQLGIDNELRDKLTYSNALDGGVERITRGEADIGIYPVSEVIAVPGVSLVGLLPPALQSLIIYGAGVLTKSAVAEPAIAFITFLTDPAHRPIWTKAGFEPPP